MDDHERVVECVERFFARPRRSRRLDDWYMGDALFHYWHIGRVAEAADFHRISWRNFDPNGGYYWYWAPHLSFLAVTDNLDRGLKVFDKQLPVAMRQTDLLSQYYFLSHAAPLVERLAATRDKPVSLHVPKAMELFDPSGSYRLDRIASWVVETAEKIASRFDARNGNDYQSSLLRSRRALAGSVRPFTI